MNYQFNATGIPNDLKAIPQWTLWKQGIKKRPNGKFPKVPCYELQGTLRKQRGKPKHYTFDEANRIREKHQCGIGIYLGGQLVGADVDSLPRVVSTLDDVPSNIRAVVDKIDTYTEVSQNGKGIHMLSLRSGDIPDWNNRNEETGCELYFKDRYFVVTGQSLNGAHLQTTNMGAFYRNFIKKPKGKQIIFDHSDGQGWPGTNSELVQHLESRMNKSRDIWFGDSFDTKYHSDHSGMDQALFNILAFYLPNQPDRIREVAKLSPWYESLDAAHKKKWERDDYIERTIKKAYQDVTTTYKADYGKPEVKEWDGKPAVKGEIITDHRPDLIDKVEAIVDKMPPVMWALYDDILSKSRYHHETYALFTTLFIIGTLINRRYMVDRKFANLYVHLLGKTGVGKDTPLKMAEFYIRELSLVEVIQRVASPEALEDAVLSSERGAISLIMDEYRKPTTERGIQILDDLNELSTVPNVKHRRKKIGSTDATRDKVRFPYCSVMKASTITGHNDLDSTKEFETGHGARNLYISSCRNYDRNKGYIGRELKISPTVAEWFENMAPEEEEIRTMGHDDDDDAPVVILDDPYHINYDRETTEYMSTAEDNLNIKRKIGSENVIKDTIDSRTMQYAGQIALIFQVANDPHSHEINLKWAKLGLEVMELYQHMFLKYIVPAMPKGPIMDLTKRVFDLILKRQAQGKCDENGLVPWYSITNAIRKDAKIMESVVENLKYYGKALLEIKTKKGKKSTWVKVISKKPM